MALVEATTRRTRRPLSLSRRVLRASLTAGAAVPLLTSYELTQGPASERVFLEAALAAGYTEHGGDRWPCDLGQLDDAETVLFRDGPLDVVYRTSNGTLIHATLYYGWLNVHVAAPERADIGRMFAAFRDAYPASYITMENDTRVPITFWSDSKYGPQPRLRKIEASAWQPILGNYTAEVRDELAKLMAWENGPPDTGQLILWQGPPGTGKTWALRALASEWAPWAEFHYITDPDSFFVDNPSYMVDVLLADSYDTIEPSTGELVQEQDPDGKWRVLILEDTGELLSADAKQKYGQGLSRLLNVVDGMIGQGLRVLALVTTNDELGDLHPAVSRPGRCASQIAFGPLTAEEARAFTGDPDAAGGTIAELYARMDAGKDALEETLVASLARWESWDTALTAEDVAANDVRAAIFAVATAHQDDAVGYGETAYDEETRTVLYVCGDWTDPDPIAADMLAIDGVDAFVHEAEALPQGWWDAEVVYPEDPPRWVVDQDLALEQVVELAGMPLQIDLSSPVRRGLIGGPEG